MERNIKNGRVSKFRIEAGILTTCRLSRTRKAYSLLQTSNGLVYDLADLAFEFMTSDGRGNGNHNKGMEARVINA